MKQQLGSKQFDSVDDAQTYAYTTTISQMANDLGVTQPAHIYVTKDATVEAHTPSRDSQPGNAIDFVTSYHPAVTGK